MDDVLLMLSIGFFLVPLGLGSFFRQIFSEIVVHLGFAYLSTSISHLSCVCV